MVNLSTYLLGTDAEKTDPIVPIIKAQNDKHQTFCLSSTIGIMVPMPIKITETI